MRVGINPVKNRYPVYSPKSLGVASITFAPVLEGFFREAKDVIEVHLQSIRQTVGDEADILVFDNNSCEEISNFLKDQYAAGIIDWLILSKHNLGKTGAMNWIFSAMPNEYLAYSDSDVLFRSNWIERSLEIFGSFERVGIVSAQPAFYDHIPGVSETTSQISNMSDVRLAEEEPFADALAEYCTGIGASEDVRQRLADNRLQVATNLKTGVKAVVGSTHMQFMLRKDLARKLVPLPVTHVLDSSDDAEINRRMETLGYLQLSLPDALVYHLGNTLQGQHMVEVDELMLKSGISLKGPGQVQHRSKMRSLSVKLLTKLIRRSSKFKFLINWLYITFFDTLYSDEG